MATSSYTSPYIPASAAAFADLKAGGIPAILKLQAALLVALTDPVTAPTVSLTGGGSIGGAILPGAYFVSYTNLDGYGGETLSKEVASPFTVARQTKPVQPTATPTGGGASGGLLAAGTYYIKTTFTDAAGETDGSTESALLTVSATNIPRVTVGTIPASTTLNLYITAANGLTNTEVLYASGITGVTTYDLSVAAPVSVVVPPASNTTSTTIPRVTMPALPTGAIARNVYVTPVAGLTGTEVLYATGVTATTKDLATAVVTTNAVQPTVSTSAATAQQLARLNSYQLRQYQFKVIDRASTIISNFLHGDPVDMAETMTHLQSLGLALKGFLAAFEEAAVLIAANPGTLTTTAGNIGTTTKRVFS